MHWKRVRKGCSYDRGDKDQMTKGKAKPMNGGHKHE